MNNERIDLIAGQQKLAGSFGSSGHELWMASAVQLNELLTRNEVSPIEILESVLARVEAVDQSLNAFCHIAWDSARAAAKLSETRARKGKRLGALDGIPVHVKDNIFVQGMPCTWGSRLYEDFVPERDGMPVAALRAAGAVLFGKTNTPEFALMGRTENVLFGVTKNPWDAALTPGGSSGGAASAVAAGMGPLALATDSGGSIRRPASYCGLVGLKTSHGAVPRGESFPATVYDFQTIGPLARNIADASVLFRCIARVECSNDARAMGVVRVGLLDSKDLGLIDGEVAQCLQKVGAALRELGHHVSDVGAPWNLSEIENIWQFFSSAGVARIASRFESDIWKEKASAQIQGIASAGQGLSAVQYIDHLDDLGRLRQQSLDWFADVDVIVTPTAPCTAWPVQDPYPKTIACSEAGPRSSSIYVVAANVAGLPALSIPAGKNLNGLPVGMQIIGPRGSDEVLLRIGRQLESKL